MTKAVVFDLDDTLISERQYIESGYHHIAKIISNKFGFSEKKVFRDLINLFKKSSKNVFNRLLEKYKIKYTEEVILDFVKKYREHFPKIDFYSDVIPCLEYLRLNNIKLGIITDGYANAQRQKLKALRAYDYFDEIIVTDELGREYWKPHHKAFEIIRNKLGVTFNEMIYVGDNPEKDFYIKKVYPIKTVRIFREGIYRNKEYLENIKEDYTINSLNELSSII